MNSLPPPGTFAEGQRLVYGLLAAAAGMFCGACAVAMIALLMWGGWSVAEEHSIVTIFGWSLGGLIVAMEACSDPQAPQSTGHRGSRSVALPRPAPGAAEG